LRPRWSASSRRGVEFIARKAAGSPGSRSTAIYLGRRKGRDLIYAGKVDHGFDTKSAKDLQKRLKPLIRKTQPYAKIAHRGIWVVPSLLAEIDMRVAIIYGRKSN
jgi:bifunctional non-homologous end joining protein LigD